MDNPIQDVISFFLAIKPQWTRKAGPWVEVKLGGARTSIMKLIHVNDTSHHRAALSRSRCVAAKWPDKNEWYPVLYVSAAMIQFKTEPGADHQDPTRFFNEGGN